MNLDERCSICSAGQRLHIWLENIFPQRDPHLGRSCPGHTVTRCHHIPGVDQRPPAPAEEDSQTERSQSLADITCWFLSWCKPAKERFQTRPHLLQQFFSALQIFWLLTLHIWGHLWQDPIQHQDGQSYPKIPTGWFRTCLTYHFVILCKTFPGVLHILTLVGFFRFLSGVKVRRGERRGEDIFYCFSHADFCKC